MIDPQELAEVRGRRIAAECELAEASDIEARMLARMEEQNGSPDATLEAAAERMTALTGHLAQTRGEIKLLQRRDQQAWEQSAAGRQIADATKAYLDGKAIR
ncbi:MAG TPA: hypothetical protein VLN57_21130 [Xanthobacteraceae bacterium]|nr:hypothetical protein [Xanthobacteraceae bacterium]